jgi:hypothetical protein
MMINEYVSKAMQDAAQLAGERNRRLLAARRGPAGAPTGARLVRQGIL